jgi:hypothetical protein
MDSSECPVYLEEFDRAKKNAFCGCLLNRIVTWATMVREEGKKVDTVPSTPRVAPAAAGGPLLISRFAKNSHQYTHFLALSRN